MGESYFQGPSFEKDKKKLEPIKRTKRVRISLYIYLFDKSLRSREDFSFFQIFVC